MNMNVSRLRAVLFVVLASFVLAVGCASEEEKKAEHWNQARDYMEEGKWKEAIIELRNVLQIDPWDGQAYYELGEVSMHLNELGQAFQAYQGAVTVAPQYVEAHVRIGEILLLAQRFEDARDRALLILKRSPHHLGATRLLANTYAKEEDYSNAVSTLEEAIKRAPNHVPTWLMLARFSLQEGDLERAENAYLHAAYIDFSLEGLLCEEGEPYRSIPVLARHYEGVGRWGEAERRYRQAVEVVSKGDRLTAKMDLAAFLARKGAYEKALGVLQDAAEERPGDLDILTQIAQLHLEFNHLEQAEKTVDRVLNFYEGHLGAHFLKGRILLLRNQPEEAVGHFETVLKGTSGHGKAHYLKAVALFNANEVERARGALMRALELDAELLEARLLLAKIYLRRREKGNISLAKEQLAYLLERAPNHPALLSLYGNLKIRESDFPGAKEVFERVLKLRPNDPMAHFRVGFVHFLLNKNAEAIEHFERVLAMDPEKIDVFPFLVDLHIKEGTMEDALALCRKSEAQFDTPARRATWEVLVGNLYRAKGDVKQAEGHYKEAIQQDPERLAAHYALTRLYAQSGNTDQITAHYRKTLEDNPTYLPAYMAMGLLHDEQGDKEKAEAYYREALEVSKTFGPAANNLAVILAERDDGLDEAFRWAQTAREQLPEDPYVADTLGWIHYRLGHSWKAVTELERSVSKEPGNALFHYHLGMAYYAEQNLEHAKKHLSRVLALDDSFPHAEKVRLLINQIEAALSSS